MGKWTHASPRSYWRPRSVTWSSEAGIDLVEELVEVFADEGFGVGHAPTLSPRPDPESRAPDVLSGSPE